MSDLDLERLRGIAQAAQGGDMDTLRRFRSHCSPSVCLQLIQEIQRQPKEATQIEVEGYIAEFVGDPAFVAAALLEKFSVRLKEEK